ncbi:protein-L-isoaspartate O-methyltransferase family protein [Variovorax sp. VNK109]|uniref:protein-L-isoaspartate O-methyltransferase family protein n=1 Tax=Variovorax sp. VNK109 TaxID=3400919 RepID=UPI003BFFED03
MSTDHARFNMIEQQIRPWNVLDPEILELLSVVRREDFVPLAHKALAFTDMELPLQGSSEEAQGKGEVMLAPRVEARMLHDLKVQKHEKVLEIGAGSGYMAALLAHRAQRVISLEIDAGLVAMARGNLQKAGILNVEVRQADGSKDVAVDGPYDVIVLSGSVAEVPQSLLAQLKVGGRLAAIVGEEPMMRAHFITRTGEASHQTVQPWDTVAPRLQHFPEPSRFSF